MTVTMHALIMSIYMYTRRATLRYNHNVNVNDIRILAASTSSLARESRQRGRSTCASRSFTAAITTSVYKTLAS